MNDEPEQSTVPTLGRIARGVGSTVAITAVMTVLAIELQVHLLHRDVIGKSGYIVAETPEIIASIPRDKYKQLGYRLTLAALFGVLAGIAWRKSPRTHALAIGIFLFIPTVYTIGEISHYEWLRKNVPGLIESINRNGQLSSHHSTGDSSLPATSKVKVLPVET